ncbi:MAG: GxxExxY protein [Verrucomicrobiota bacterium]
MNTKTNSEYMKAEAYALIGAAFEVYNEQGHGLSEEIYQESLEIELSIREIDFQPKQELTTYYKGRALKKKYIPDLMTHDQMIVELKALSELNGDHEAQVLNYMKITKQPIGYLLNFGKPDGVQWKRLIQSEFLK